MSLHSVEPQVQNLWGALFCLTWDNRRGRIPTASANLGTASLWATFAPAQLPKGLACRPFLVPLKECRASKLPCALCEWKCSIDVCRENPWLLSDAKENGLRRFSPPLQPTLPTAAKGPLEVLLGASPPLPQSTLPLWGFPVSISSWGPSPPLSFPPTDLVAPQDFYSSGSPLLPSHCPTCLNHRPLLDFGAQTFSSCPCSSGGLQEYYTPLPTGLTWASPIVPPSAPSQPQAWALWECPTRGLQTAGQMKKSWKWSGD